MSLRTPSNCVNWSAPVVATLNTETIMFTSNPVNQPFDNAQIILTWFLGILTGTVGTSCIIRIRRGNSLTGTPLTQNFSQLMSANTGQVFTGTYSDLPGITAGQQYVVTYQASGATSNATLNDGSFAVYVL